MACRTDDSQGTKRIKNGREKKQKSIVHSVGPSLLQQGQGKGRQSLYLALKPGKQDEKLTDFINF